MYSLSYDFGRYNEVISVYIESLIEQSKNNFQQQLRSGQIKNKEKDSNALAGLIQNVEEYLYYNYKKSPHMFNHILNTIMNKVRTVAVLPTNKRGIYGEAQDKNKIVYVNPDLTGNRNLTSEERIRLYMAHELGHIVNSHWMNRAVSYANSLIAEGILSRDQAQLIYDGFSMLDEAITQNRAENFAYDFSNKKRPNLDNRVSRNLFNGEVFHSNYDFYAELQEPAIMFARTLRGIGKEHNDMLSLNLLSERALNPNFLNSIIDEYTKDNQMPAFFQIVQSMGLLKRASYANFGYENATYLQNSKKYLDYFKKITSLMRDYREPFESEIQR